MAAKYVIRKGYKIPQVNGTFLEAGTVVTDEKTIAAYKHMLERVQEQKANEQKPTDAGAPAGQKQNGAAGFDKQKQGK